VARTPDGTAVTYKNQQLTYQALNQQANRLARQLRQAGITPDSVVAIYLNPSPEMIIAVLAILKAGGAYLPLDPDYPQERLAFMLEDAQATVLITAQSGLKPLPLPATTQIIHLDSMRPSGNNSPNLTPWASPDNLAYVIYTSGSTGRPKGVMIPHRGVVNYLRWCIDAYDVKNGRGSLVHSSLAFDLTVTSLFAPLLVGKTVALLPSDPGGEALYTALLASQDLSLIKLTPSHLDVLNHRLPPTTIANRTQHLIIGGEALHPQTLHFWQTYAPQTRLINEYGPTETVVGCSY